MTGSKSASGLLLLDKESGRTSFEALSPVKRLLGTGKVGHTGTLDKFASGLLAVLTGSALKLAPWFTSCDKEYEAVVLFGSETDTLDPEGKIIAEAPPPSRDYIEKILPRFTGEILQAPPAYSAVHINGKRAYELARDGKEPEMKNRNVTIYNLALEKWEAPYATFRVNCSSGTYIRSLARDIALAADSRAHLSALRRTRIGGFEVQEAFRLTDDKAECAENIIRPPDTNIFEKIGLSYTYINDEEEKMISVGKPLEFIAGKLPEAAVLGLFSKNTNELIAVIEHKNGHWKYSHVFSA